MRNSHEIADSDSFQDDPDFVRRGRRPQQGRKSQKLKAGIFLSGKDVIAEDDERLSESDSYMRGLGRREVLQQKAHLSVDSSQSSAFQSSDGGTSYLQTANGRTLLPKANLVQIK